MYFNLAPIGQYVLFSSRIIIIYSLPEINIGMHNWFCYSYFVNSHRKIKSITKVYTSISLGLFARTNSCTGSQKYMPIRIIRIVIKTVAQTRKTFLLGDR